MWTTDGLRQRAPTEWQGAGECPQPIGGDVEQIACWVRVETELEFDEGDAIHRLDQLALWELRRRLQGSRGASKK